MFINLSFPTYCSLSYPHVILYIELSLITNFKVGGESSRSCGGGERSPGRSPGDSRVQILGGGIGGDLISSSSISGVGIGCPPEGSFSSVLSGGSLRTGGYVTMFVRWCVISTKEFLGDVPTSFSEILAETHCDDAS